MSSELEKLLDGDKSAVTPPASAEKSAEELAAEETRKKEEQLANLNKAIEEGNNELRKIRKAKKDGVAPEDIEDELPKIDLNDPSSKAWDKHMKDQVSPLTAELEKEKEEIRTFALQKFLADKPNLANDPEKIKKVIATYDKIKTASERTQEGVLIDLRKAYAAEFSDELINGAIEHRISEAQGDAIFSDAGVSRGSTTIPTEREKAPRLSREDEVILAKWGLSPQEWVKLKQAQDKK